MTGKTGSEPSKWLNCLFGRAVKGKLVVRGEEERGNALTLLYNAVREGRGMYVGGGSVY